MEKVINKINSTQEYKEFLNFKKENTKVRRCSSCVYFETYNSQITMGKCHKKNEIINDARKQFVCKYHELRDMYV